MFTPYKFRIKLFTLLVSILLLNQSCNYNDNENSIGFEPIEAMYNYNVHDRLFDANWKFLKEEVKGGQSGLEF